MRISDWSSDVCSSDLSFQRRLLHYVREVEFSAWSGDVDIHFGRADAATAAELGFFDLVLTSQPYCDSLTTVQYESAYAIRLDVVSRLHGLHNNYLSGRAIDCACLGCRPIGGGVRNLKHSWP